MKFLFTAPRFHTNQSAIVKGLTEHGHEVRYFVVYVGATEDHSVIRPLALKPSRTTVREKKAYSRQYNESEVEGLIGGRFIPDFAFFKKAFEEFMPDVVICREKTNLTLYAKALCDQHRIPCILYDQEPVYPAAKEKTGSPQAKQAAASSFSHRLSVKLDRTLNPDRRRLAAMRASSGFPTVHMTPVQYSRISAESSGTPRESGTYFIPFIAEAHPEAIGRTYRGDGVLHILSVGKFRDYKNLKILPDTMELLQANGFSDWSLTVVGQVSNSDEKQYRDDLLHAIAEKGLEDKVRVIENVPFQEMGAIYSTHDLFLLTSKREVASVAVIEAMSYGLAIISTDHNGTASYVTDAEGGYVFETGNAKDLADKIRLAAGEVQRMGQNAATYVAEHLQFENYAAAMAQMLEKEFDLHMGGAAK